MEILFPRCRDICAFGLLVNCIFSSIFVIISLHLWGVLVLEKVKWEVWFFLKQE